MLIVIEPDQNSTIPKKIWTIGGVTEHLGGVRATRNLLQACQIISLSTVLDVGCGTGYSACLLAKSQPQRILAMDLNSTSLRSAQKRVVKEGYRERIDLLQADAHHIPLPDRSIDVTILESVLVFCDAPEALSEIRRVLKVGGRLGDNEMTLLKPPTDQLTHLLKDVMGVNPHLQNEWEEIYRKAGFEVMQASIGILKLSDQFSSHMKVDGLGNYLKAVIAGLSDKTLWRTFINREMWRAFMDFRDFIGYGTYVMKRAA